MKIAFYQSYGKAILIVTALMLPLIMFGAVESFKTTSHNVRQWLPDDFEEIEIYDWFVQKFGRDEIAMVSWPGCSLSDTRVERLAAELSQLTLTNSVAGSGSGSSSAQPLVFDRVVTGPGALRQLTSGKIRLSRQSALRRLSGNFIGPDGKTTGLLLSVSEFGSKNRGAVIDEVCRVAKSSCGLEAADLRLGGPTVDAVANYRASRRILYELAGASVLIVFLVAWLRLRRLALAVPLLITALLSTAAALAALYYSGGQMNLTMTTLPTLVFVLTTSGALHLTYYYRQAFEDPNSGSAPDWAIAQGWRPCVLATMTTAIGLASLGLSRILPVREFGLYSAFGMVVSLIVLLLVLPSLWACWPFQRSDESRDSDLLTVRKNKSWQRKLATYVIRYRTGIVAGFALLTLPAIVGIGKLESSVKIQNRFAAKSKIIGDYHWLEEHLCPLVPIEIVIRFGAINKQRTIERLELVRGIEREIGRIKGVGATVSAATFAPAIPRGDNARSFARRHQMDNQLLRDRQKYLDTGYTADDRDSELWRITARVRALDDTDYGVFIDTLKTHVDSLLDGQGVAGVSAEYTGAIPLLYKCLRLLLNDLVRSFLFAFGTITIVMIIALRGVSFGLLGMIPNLLPILLVFGCMGWMAVSIESGIVKTASIALGIAVDDTFHFLSWYRRALVKNRTRKEAIGYSFDHSAAAMFSTTLICGFGFSIFTLSEFMPIVRFAVLMIALLVVALVADLVLLPALLYTTKLPRRAAD